MSSVTSQHHVIAHIIKFEFYARFVIYSVVLLIRFGVNPVSSE